MWKLPATFLPGSSRSECFESARPTTTANFDRIYLYHWNILARIQLMTQVAYLWSETPSGMWSTIISTTSSFPPKKQTNIQHTSQSRSFLLSHPSPNLSQRQALENVKNTGTIVLSFYPMLIILESSKPFASAIVLLNVCSSRISAKSQHHSLKQAPAFYLSRFHSTNVSPCSHIYLADY